MCLQTGVQMIVLQHFHYEVNLAFEFRALADVMLVRTLIAWRKADQIHRLSSRRTSSAVPSKYSPRAYSASDSATSAMNRARRASRVSSWRESKRSSF